jgi:hypothetical protein
VVGQFEILSIPSGMHSTGRWTSVYRFMTIKRTPRPRDPIQLGKLIGDIATGQTPNVVDDGKDAGAAAMGRKGAAARAAGMTPERRAEVAKKAAEKRWQKT